MTRQLIAIIAAALSLVACGDYAPDNDVQISFEGASDRELELYTHAANAAAELAPSLEYLVDVRDPEITGVTWRTADQWRIVIRPVGYQITSPRGTVRTLGCTAETMSLGVTSYRDQTIYVADCEDGAKRWDWSAVVKHEIGHALGMRGHIDAPGAVMRPKAGRDNGHAVAYTDADVEAIAHAQRHQFNDVLDAVWVD
jgi:hypothetical protein